jgi:hypothetical protein
VAFALHRGGWRGQGRFIMRYLLPWLGAGVMLLILADLFLTVLYARVGRSLFSNRLARLVWQLFRRVARQFPRCKGEILSYCGPLMLLVLVGIWTLGLSLGAGMVVYPKLGKSVVATGGPPTETDFLTAIYVGGKSLTVVGAGDFSPQTTAFRLFFMMNSVIGFSMLSLTLTYLMQIYSALQRRNVAALEAHISTDDTGDAAELIAGLGPEGAFPNPPTRLEEMAAEMADVKETHHFYSLLMYFRFRETFYSPTHLALLDLDTVALIKSALDDEKYRWLKESGAVADLWRATMRALAGMAESLLPGGLPDAVEPQEKQKEQWRQRYFAALRRLRQAGIQTIHDEQAGAETYISLRAMWDRFIREYSRFMAYEMREIDPACTNPQQSDLRQEFRTRLRAAG